ncbi:MAG: hypothetical protein ACN6OP_02470 [Pseudomonadales bacterium]
MYAFIRCLILAMLGVLLASCTTPKGHPGDAQPQSNAVPAAAAHWHEARMDFRIAKTEPAGNLNELSLGANRLYYLPTPLLSRGDLAHVLPMRDARGNPFVRFTLTSDGARKLEAIIRHNTGEWLLFSIDDTVMAITRINGASTGTTLDIGMDSAQRALYVVAKANVLPASGSETLPDAYVAGRRSAENEARIGFRPPDLQ